MLLKWRYNLILALVITFTMACDPCRQLAERICQCHETEEDQKKCLADLNMASQHEYFSKNNHPQLCEDALTKCGDCAKINNDKDYDNCGIYRSDLHKR